MILGVTGHRPNKLGGYSDKVFNNLTDLAVGYLRDHRPEIVIVGLAMGWDMAVANAAWNLQIPFYAYIPFEGQAEPWSIEWRTRWWMFRDCAKKEKIFGEGYSDKSMKDRNKGIVDDSDAILALFDGYPSGTKHAVDYALQRGKPVTNLWMKWHD